MGHTANRELISGPAIRGRELSEEQMSAMGGKLPFKFGLHLPSLTDLAVTANLPACPDLMLTVA